MDERLIETATTNQHVWEAGSGPLVIFCHGFPELGWSWRHQVEAVAAAGYHAVAPDMRGYGGTDAPEGVEAYSIFRLVGDMVALVQALGETSAVVVGHDWGAPVAWHCALLRPDVFRAVACLSVPFTPRRANRPPIPTFQAIAKAMGKEFYILRFQPPGIEADFDANPEQMLRTAFRAYDGATPDEERSSGFLDPGLPIMQALGKGGALPPWMDEADLKVYVDAFSAKGFTGPVNWYRNLDRNWAEGAFLQDKRIEVPGWFMVGEKDPVRGYSGSGEAELEQWVPDLRAKVVVPGAGHWIQQERPDVVNQALIEFLRSL
jgi:pimeloyl-ACP methyl ester carboxylesterase